jgi:hypothetical protein
LEKSEIEVEELENEVEELKKKNANTPLETISLLMTIRRLKPSYAKMYKSKYAEALSPVELEEIINRFQRLETTWEISEFRENIQTYGKNKNMMDFIKSDLNRLLKRCSYADLKDEIIALLREHFDCNPK